MRSDRREGDAERIDERTELRTTLTDALHAVCERFAAACAHLDLGRDQLADEMRLDVGPDRGLLHILEPADETERGWIEERELLLHRDGEVGNLLERGLRGGQQLSVADLLL